MVKILSNGDIVSDDDPRAQTSSTGRSRSNDSNRSRQGFVQHTDHGEQNMEGQGIRGRSVSVFHMLNEKLLALGIPRFSIGQFTFEPIVSVGFLLAGIFFGLPGLLFAGLLFVVSNLSQMGGNPFTGGGGGGGLGGNSGHRLGSS